MAANRGAVEHVLPVVGEPQIDQRLQKPITDPLFGPAPEPDIDGVPLAIAPVYVAPGTADLQNMKQPVQEPPITDRRTRPEQPLNRQNQHAPGTNIPQGQLRRKAWRAYKYSLVEILPK